MTGTSWLPTGYLNPNPSRISNPWVGCDNPNLFYTPQDFFDRSKFPAAGSGKLTPPTFVDRLTWAGTNMDSYNRYTFYRLLSQLGSDSPPEPGGKMNLNYRNVTNGYVVPNLETNYAPWLPEEFFTNAAIRLLADAGYAVGPPNGTNILVLGTTTLNGITVPVTNLHIPILPPNNCYTPSVHRLLQLAANMYDATSTNLFPTLFQPMFQDARGPKTGGGVYIIGYKEITTSVNLNAVPHDLTDVNDPKPVKMTDMVYNVPLVVGAKKGYPNFNEFAMHSQVQLSRKLQFVRQSGVFGSTVPPIVQTNQMFLVGISNVMGVELWNSYAPTFTHPVQLFVYPDITLVLTNETGTVFNPPTQRYQPLPLLSACYTTNSWVGYIPSSVQEKASFILPFSTNLMFLTNSVYRQASQTFVPADSLASGTFEALSPAFYVPHWWLGVKARLRVAMVDTSVNRIVDYVNLSEQNQVDVTADLMDGGQCGTSYSPDGSYGSFWCTNHYPNLSDATVPTYGVLNQIAVSMAQQPAYNDVVWNSPMNGYPATMGTKEYAIDFFRAQFGFGPRFVHPPNTVFYKSNTFAAPFQPLRTMYLLTSWQANDPLVHYTVGDLASVLHTNRVMDQFSSTEPDPVANLGALNGRYEPWGGNPYAASASPTQVDPTVKDPLMNRSDYWDFPTNKFPNVGWLGRIHRGTPWQTVYFKSFNPTNYGTWFNNWLQFSGNNQYVANLGQISTNVLGVNQVGYDAGFTQPTNDWRLLDLFTSALSDNATRGQLSINQTNLAAWSAVLSGVLTLTNEVDANGNPILLPQTIEPAGLYDPFNTNTWPPLVQLVKRINDVRAASSPRQVFSHLSEILAVPELTFASPFLNSAGLPSMANNGLNDEAIERLPQQILGLLKCDNTPRFVIYAYGQTLKPALGTPYVRNGSFTGLCTNYQIVAEAATRTVVRFEGVQPYLPGTGPTITNLHPVIESFNVLPTD